MQIKCEKKFQIDQHLGTESHKTKQSHPKKLLQQLLTGESNNNQHSEQENFCKDLCNVFIGCNIPLYKLDQPLFRNFFKAHCKENVNLPSSSNLRKKYVDINYDAALTNIRDELKNKSLWFSVDETTDVKGRYVANLIVGALNENGQGKGHLISVKVLEKTNNLTIARFVNESFSSFYLPEAVPSENLLLMVTDAAPYMVKAAENLKIFYPKLIHCTCLAHGLNRVAETVRSEFPLINTLVTNIKKNFVKAPQRVQFYKEKLPGVPLPPEPVLTRWGTWLNCVNFLAENYVGIKNVISEFDPKSSAALEKCLTIFKNPLVENQLTFVKSNYVCIATAITKLESRGLALKDSINIVTSLKNNIEISGSKSNGNEIYNKFNAVINKNEGFKKLVQINNILQGNFDENDTVDPNIICKFKFAPITSCEVERSFSAYKQILSDKRQSFTSDNIEKYLIAYCYNAINNNE